MSAASTIAKLSSTLGTLVPRGCAFAVTAVDGSHVAKLSQREHAWSVDWGVHRLQEFAAGRFCAHSALAQLQVVCDDLLPDARGLPVWPECVLGSISHSRGIALAVLTRNAPPRLLGVDLEKTNRLSVAAIQKVVHPLEMDFVAGDQLRASVLFSLKEAFYKAQFAHCRTDGNFQDLALALDMQSGVARVLLLERRFATELQHLNFRFRLVDDYVLSLCWL
ncbi:4'-phosphopantetheinyl transferase superfamily protein [Coraliomargarita sp. SDUM461004]|uniref:Enterobactin synthase component D n=1 Tax=Thalassobacterium sedimentorum TaxID=3041258 RepID=A0ABU1AJI0_9BACT|nr:4'-phosphopantetheinyl transferase superfamily protein [Coraliomargarita sp. SDUM461004]MDQ8194909.1 4'-phosphopantetheinyl transferase superfamily protein [Coraliomargarita sp. SDUM461004]